MRVVRFALLRAGLSVAMLLAALGAGARVRSEAPGLRPQEQTSYIWTGEEGTIQGVVSVVGEVPPRPPIPMDVDPVCASLNKGGARLDDIVVERGRLANALVYIAPSSLEGYKFEPQPWTPALGKRKCFTV